MDRRRSCAYLECHFDNGDVRSTTIVFHPHRFDGVRIQEETINTLTAFMGTGGLNTPMVATVFSHTQGLDPQASEEASPTLRANGNGMAVAYPVQGNMIGRSDNAGPQGKGYGDENDPMFSLTSTDQHAVATSQVRRLTPLECERLQGFPDGWTEGQSDSTRYKQMGNAVAVPVVEWLIQGITG